MRSSRLLPIAAAAAVLGLSIAASGAPSDPMLIAHRGGAGLWPENTMGAFRNAHALFTAAGVPGWLELDTQFTSDQVLVVIHDATLDGTTDCSGAVVDQPASTVTACDADPGPAVDPVPALAQILSEGRDSGWRLMIEIKNIPGEPGFDADCNELAAGLVAEIDAAVFPTENLIVESFYPLCLDRLESTAPEIATLLLTSSSTINDLTGIATPIPLGFTLTENAIVATLRGYEYSAPDQAAPDLIGPVVNLAHVLGRRVIVWTVDEVARMQELAAIGVDGLISDRPDLLVSTFTP